jgi:hypothetical protein
MKYINSLKKAVRKVIKSKRTLFLEAARAGDVRSFNQLFNGTTPDDRKEALMAAARYDRQDVVDLLIKELPVHEKSQAKGKALKAAASAFCVTGQGSETFEHLLESAHDIPHIDVTDSVVMLIESRKIDLLNQVAAHINDFNKPEMLKMKIEDRFFDPVWAGKAASVATYLETKLVDFENALRAIGQLRLCKPYTPGHAEVLETLLRANIPVYRVQEIIENTGARHPGVERLSSWVEQKSAVADKHPTADI